ncbi:unnamed protein product [Lathyrus oleraceus]|uniref:Uncharacterized protein n=1 Tax=Pisum sativum TaxID=3888 RepID=A0A9D4XFB7_PEA|nr:uncharacterized protein LOC127074508 [Pisum sativum]KAI5418230.1 hypothetical protein KIW84_042743 [Pisum sativum]
MGNCSSFDSSQVETAKVVAHDGTMKEFSYAVKVSYLLQLYPGCFICDSDEMGFDDVVVAMHEDEVLILGQLYFALPLNRLKKPLPMREMAALAVKASSALNKCGAGEKVGFRRKRILVFSGEGNGKSGRRVSPDISVSVGRSRSGRNFGGGRGKFVAELSCIPE